jgi:hypothetical protein
MHLVEIFYSTFWVSAFSVIWFYTDWFIHYTQLFGIAENQRLKYISFIAENPDKYFPDFLHEMSLHTDNKIIKFILKLVSCPLCLSFWLSGITALVYTNASIIAPVYIISLFILLQIKKML